MYRQEAGLHSPFAQEKRLGVKLLSWDSLKNEARESQEAGPYATSSRVANP